MATAERTLNIAVKFTDELTRPLSASERALAKFGTFAKATFSTLTSAVFNLKTAVAGLFAAYSIKQVAERAESMQRLAEATGDTTRNISELAAVFSLSSVKLEQFETITVKLVKAQAEALRGSDDMRAAFAQLGITVEDLASLGPAQLMERIALGLERYETAQQKVAVLGRILPKQFADALPVLGKGITKLQEDVLRVRRLNATVTDEQAAAADKWGDALDEIQLALGGVTRELIRAFGPDATALLTKLADLIADNRDGLVKLGQSIAQFFVNAIKVAVSAVIGLVEAVEAIPGVDLFPQEARNAQLQRIEEITKALREARVEQRVTASQLRGESPNTSLVVPPSADRANELRGQLSQQTAVVQRLEAELQDLQKRIGMELGATMRATYEQLLAELSVASAAIESQISGTGDALQEDGLKKLHEYMREFERVQILTREAAVNTGTAVSSVLQQSTKDQRELAAVIEQTNNEFKELKDENSKEVPNTFTAGLKNRFEQLRDSATNFARSAGEAFADVTLQGLDGLSEGLAQVIAGTMSAKEAFKAFAKQFLLDIARMISKMIVLGTIKTIFGLETGGVVSGGMQESMPIRTYAKGGIARRPQLAVFGEGRTAEAFVPLPDNRSIPVTFTGNGQSGGTVNVNITAMDSKDVARALNEHSSLLRSIWTNGVERSNSMRHTVQRAAS